MYCSSALQTPPSAVPKLAPMRSCGYLVWPCFHISFHTTQRFISDVMNEKIPDDQINNRREHTDPKSQVMRDCYQHAIRRIGECPDHAHPFCPGFQMMKMNFEAAAIDHLLRRPRDRNPGARRCHHYDVAIGTALQKSDVAVMRQDF